MMTMISTLNQRINPSDQIYIHCVCVLVAVNQGSIRFDSYCYNVGAETKTFDDAKRTCSEAGAHLVDVGDRYSFIHSSRMYVDYFPLLFGN